VSDIRLTYRLRSNVGVYAKGKFEVYGLKNPDGPEAADVIDALVEALKPFTCDCKPPDQCEGEALPCPYLAAATIIAKATQEPKP
jgi:hypothetical protein